MAITAYLYTSCTSCRKTDEVLEASGVKYDRREYFREKFSKEELRELLVSHGLTVADVISNRSTPYKANDLENRDMSDDEILDLMIEDPRLLRRPIVISGERVVIGHDESKLHELIGAERGERSTRVAGRILPLTLDFGTHASASGGVDKALQRAVDVGATSCQIFSKNERQWNARPLDPAVVERFHEERERTGIRQMVVHDSYLINLASPKEDILAKSMGAFQDELERCDLLGIRYLVTHPGAHTGSGVDAGIRTFADSLNRIFDTIPDNQAITCLETTAGQGTALGRTFEEIAAITDLVEAKDRVGVCFDTCHTFAAGYDIRTAEGVTSVLDEFDRVVGLSRLHVLHLNDSKNPLGSNKDRHDHVGEGEIGIEGFRAIVNEARLAGLPAILETEKDSDGEYDRKNLALLRGLVGARRLIVEDKRDGQSGRAANDYTESC